MTIVNKDNVYLLGGMDASENAMNTAEAYDVKADKWMTLDTEGSMLPRWGHSVGIHDDRLFVIGGRNWDNISVRDRIDVLDLKTRKWDSLVMPLPTLFTLGAPAQIGSSLYLLEGNDFIGDKYDSIFVFDLQTRTLQHLPIQGFGALDNGFRLYLSIFQGQLFVTGIREFDVKLNGSSFEYFSMVVDLTSLTGAMIPYRDAGFELEDRYFAPGGNTVDMCGRELAGIALTKDGKSTEIWTDYHASIGGSNGSAHYAVVDNLLMRIKCDVFSKKTQVSTLSVVF